MGAHAFTGGALSDASGGSFWSGAAAGGLSSLTGSLIGASGLSGTDLDVAQWAGGGLSGGVGSLLAGGTFIEGARQGLITGGLNHAMHEIVNTHPDPIPTIEIEGILYFLDGNAINNFEEYFGITPKYRPYDGPIELSGDLPIAPGRNLNNTVVRTKDVLKHIFRDKRGHVNPTTKVSTERFIWLFENVGNGTKNSAVLSDYQRAVGGFEGYFRTCRGGQVWVQVRNGKIFNAGINRTPKY